METIRRKSLHVNNIDHMGSDRINQVIERANRPVFHIGEFPEMGRPAPELHLFLIAAHPKPAASNQAVFCRRRLTPDEGKRGDVIFS
jgi:hypothetical protein